MSRQITMCSHSKNVLSGEVLEDGVYWQVPEFACSDKTNSTVALLERLDIIQVEAQMDADVDGGVSK